MRSNGVSVCRREFRQRMMEDGTMLHGSGAVLVGGIFVVVLLHCVDYV